MQDDLIVHLYEKKEVDGKGTFLTGDHSFSTYAKFNSTLDMRGKYQEVRNVTLRKKCPYSELFWSVFSRIRTEYGEIRKMRTRITPNTNTFHAVLVLGKILRTQ